MPDALSYGALFLAAFLAATILPAQSEMGLAFLVNQAPEAVILLVAIASAGNILGALVNWYLGRFANHWRDRRWFPISASQLDKATIWYQRYGKYSLLASWVPIIGDPITLAAGLLRTPFFPFLILVSIAKTARYLIIAWLALW